MSASANTVGGVPVGREDDAAPAAAAATADVVVVKLKQPLSPEKKTSQEERKRKREEYMAFYSSFFFPKILNLLVAKEIECFSLKFIGCMNISNTKTKTYNHYIEIHSRRMRKKNRYEME